MSMFLRTPDLGRTRHHRGIATLVLGEVLPLAVQSTGGSWRPDRRRAAGGADAGDRCGGQHQCVG